LIVARFAGRQDADILEASSWRREGEARRNVAWLRSARQQIFWKRARQRSTLSGGST
jgi:hypothetical protein